MGNNILVTIAIPLYNKEQYIERCFYSVAKQIYKNIECIIVEDCSTDNSLELAECLIREYIGDIKFVLIRHDQNYGLSISRNTGINNANGEYLFFFDADDEITENCISTLVALAEKYPGIDMIQGNRIRRDKSVDALKTKEGKLPEYVKGNSNIKKACYKNIHITTWNKLVRKDFIKSNYLYFKKGLIHQDSHWKIFYLKYIESFAFTNEVTYIYNIVPDSIKTNLNLSLSISSRLTIVEDMLNNLDIDLLDEQLLRICELLKEQKKRIFSDKKYSSFIPKYKTLQARVPNTCYFIFLPIRLLGITLIRAIKAIVRGIIS